MKPLLFILSFFVACTMMPAQKTFCDGWNDGYAAGKQSQNHRTYTTPTCPTARIGQDTYEVGYSRGYEKATGDHVTIISREEGNTGNDFCDGWEKGYANAMHENDKSTFTRPTCPTPRGNENSYDGGYQRGYQKGLERLGVEDNRKPVVPSDNSKTFCDGWDEGYRYGLQEWARENNRTASGRSTPICPAVSYRENNYQTGFDKGRERALKDME